MAYFKDWRQDEHTSAFPSAVPAFRRSVRDYHASGRRRLRAGVPVYLHLHDVRGGMSWKKIDASYEVGEEVTDEVIFANFGRRAILNLRQTLASKILELEKDSIYNKYIDKVGNIINAEVYQIWKKEMLLLDDEGNELLLPKTEQIPSDFYRKGETARAVVARVDNKNNNPKIILSRTKVLTLLTQFFYE